MLCYVAILGNRYPLERALHYDEMWRTSPMGSLLRNHMYMQPPPILEAVYLQSYSVTNRYIPFPPPPNKHTNNGTKENTTSGKICMYVQRFSKVFACSRSDEMSWCKVTTTYSVHIPCAMCRVYRCSFELYASMINTTPDRTITYLNPRLDPDPTRPRSVAALG
ncbi:hypothetical protein BO78DRAFT_466480 [Aspergillus sclerotiicarbonarius CBS 121057]|uniref:Uncharacterized protein n=1 Tax=Aspergillus sclerotiicarbonarius (strain CBS 121057 / IBT 28362) TaxID=1448318 RepID=A0A319F636_ASPSB|nr:hypothetical protein BO78DRAFT_466480 [Aspergillus sclerotiicarbonarius CBS 121057]